jgi:hypothetical protein
MSGPLCRSRSRRALLLLAPVMLAAALTSLAGAASGAPPALSGLGAWAAAGSRLAFVATVGGRHGLWVERFGSGRPTRIGPAVCVKQEQIDQLAAGPVGSWSCLERTVGNTEAYYSVDVVSSSGVSRQVASAGGPTGEGKPPVDSIPQLFGDGDFLGYLHVTAEGVVQLMRITAGARPRHIATLGGISVPTAVAIAGRTIAVLQHAGKVSVFTTAGEPLATIPAKAASLALTANRVVVRTTNRRLVVYGLRGGLVHSWPLGASTWTSGRGAYGGYAVYLGADKAVRAVRLSSGRDRIVTRAGSGWFFDGLSLQAPGVVVPRTTKQGKNFLVTMRFLPITALRAAVG